MKLLFLCTIVNTRSFFANASDVHKYVVQKYSSASSVVPKYEEEKIWKDTAMRLNHTACSMQSEVCALAPQYLQLASLIGFPRYRSWSGEGRFSNPLAPHACAQPTRAGTVHHLGAIDTDGNRSRATAINTGARAPALQSVFHITWRRSIRLLYFTFTQINLANYY